MKATEFETHLKERLIPFWRGLRDDTYGGYYGWLGFDLTLDKKAIKGCILNSRILWFFSNAYRALGDPALLDEAKHAYRFMTEHCLDRTWGGILWSITYDGQIDCGSKYTYNQAFAIYALASYYRVSGDPEALKEAFSIFDVIEERCTDANGYTESFTREFQPIDNEELSENGVIADKTMNTLLHVFEAYTELYDVTKDARVAAKLKYIIDTFLEKVYNPERRRQEVFFDANWKSLIDLHSFGHDIETAWLLDHGADVLGDAAYAERIHAVTKELEACVYRLAYRNRSLANEAENGVVKTERVWWIQAETVVGFYNAWQKAPEHTEYKKASEDTWDYIQDYLVDPREGSEWFWKVTEEGKPIEENCPIVEPWKCPYHNGRMCFEMMRRLS